ncbi:MAG: hypothetical protein IKH00_07195 [Bacteroidales bacterium]|nr:hypothetical protein [Bacteroidales bacterium]
MHPFETAKEAYASPEINTIELVTQGSLLHIISNPEGTVPGLDPDEG